MRLIETPWPDRVCVIANVTSFDEWFTDEERAITNAFRLAKRREEWLHSRVAAKQLAVQLGLTSDARTCVIERPRFGEFHVSFSHSHPYAGAALSREPIGLDVQTVREFDEGAAHLFLSDEETEMMRNQTVAHRALHFWCAKEAAWKRHGGSIATLKQVPLRVIHETERGIVFDDAETIAIDDVVIAVSSTELLQ